MILLVQAQELLPAGAEGDAMAKNDRWYELDNAAKIIPSTTVGADTRVFRICCELREDVDEDSLQRALDKTIRDFPYIKKRAVLVLSGGQRQAGESL